jgi:hypothetical protein
MVARQHAGRQSLRRRAPIATHRGAQHRAAAFNTATTRVLGVSESVRDGVEERRAATFAQHTGHAFQVRANSEQANDERRVSYEVTSSDDAAHELLRISWKPVPVSTSRATALSTSWVRQCGRTIANLKSDPSNVKICCSRRNGSENFVGLGFHG